MASNGVGIEELPETKVVDANDIIVVKDLWRTYDMGSEQQVQALRGVSLRIRRNEYVAIMVIKLHDGTTSACLSRA